MEIKMDTQRIEIRIKDNWKFCEVAFLVDRDDFLRDIGMARKSLGVMKLIPYNELIKWTSAESIRTTKKTKFRKIKSDYFENKYVVPAGKSEIIVDELKKKYRKAHNFWPVIESAMLAGVVTKDEFSISAYCKVIYPEDYELSVTEPDLAIIISPDTKLNDIEELFKTNIPEAVDEYKDLVLRTKRRTPDTISNIKRDREWYWLKHQGLSYSKIEDMAKPKVSKDVVIKAIKQYKARLSMEL